MAISPDCPVCLYRCRWLCACLSEILTRGDRCIQFISQLWWSSRSSPFWLSSFSPSPVPPSLLFLSLTLGSPSPLLLSQPPLSPLPLWWTWGSGSVCRESHQPETPTRLAGSSSHPGGAGSPMAAACRWKAVQRRHFTYSVRKVIFGWRRSRKPPLGYWQVTWVPRLGAVRVPSGGRDVLSRRSDVSKSRNLLSSCHSGLFSQEFFSANFLHFKAVSGELYTCATIKIGQWKLHFFFMPFAHFLNGFRHCVLQIFVQLYHLSFAFYILLFLRK